MNVSASNKYAIQIIHMNTVVSTTISHEELVGRLGLATAGKIVKKLQRKKL